MERDLGDNIAKTKNKYKYAIKWLFSRGAM